MTWNEIFGWDASRFYGPGSVPDVGPRPAPSSPSSRRTLGAGMRALIAESSLHAVARNVGGGVLCGFLAVVQSAGFGMLLLVGDTQWLAPTVIGMALFSTAVMATVAALTSSTIGVVAISQGIPIAALTGGVAHIVAVLGGGADQAVVAVTVVAFVALASLAIGAVSLLIGLLRAGRFIRFVPFPVIGGFLAGSGWLIFIGGVGLVAGRSLTFDGLDRLVDPDTLTRLAATGAFIVVVLGLRRWLPISLVLPIGALIAVAAFEVGMLMTGASRDEARAAGWLVEIAGNGSIWPPVTPSSLVLIDWGAIAGALVHLPIVVVLTILAVLMNAAGIELDSRRDIDLDRELRSVGFQNLLGGAGGGMPGFLSVSLTALSLRLGAAGPLVGIIVSGFAIAALMLGETVLSIVPTPLLGGLLIWMGAALQIAWLVNSYPKLTRWEYSVIVLIFGVIIVFGFAIGILVGLIAAVVLFALEYSRVEIVRHVLTGRDYQSSHDNSLERRDALQAVGDSILVVRLQGFLFFGTADRLRNRIRERIESHANGRITHLVVDFRRVSGLDSSAVMSFLRLSQMTRSHGFTLVLSGMSEAVRNAIRRGGFDLEHQAAIRLEHDLDHALEACENELLATAMPSVLGNAPIPIGDLLAAILSDASVVAGILPYLERLDVPAGQKLIDQGSASREIFFIEHGRAAVVLEAGEGDIRLATMGRGAIAGEMAFYLGRPRSASVIAETALVVWRLSGAGLDKLRREKPDTIIDFHLGMAAVLADRLASANRLVKLLAD